MGKNISQAPIHLRRNQNYPLCSLCRVFQLLQDFLRAFRLLGPEPRTWFAA